MPKVRLLPLLLLLLAPSLASAQDMFVLILTPERAVATEGGWMGAAMASAAGLASKWSTEGAVPKVVEGFKRKGVKAEVGADKYRVPSPLPCSVIDGRGKILKGELPPGTYWLLSVHTSGFMGALGDVSNKSTRGLLENFQAEGLAAAVCSATP